MIEIVREREVAAAPADVWAVVATPQRAPEWFAFAERLDGRPAPVFARSTRFQISLEPRGTGTLVRLRSAQEPASAVKGLVMRAFGTRDIASAMDRSLDRLSALFPGA